MNNSDTGATSPSRRPADIVLAICPPWGVDVPPIGIHYLAASLTAAGLRTELLDINLQVYRTVEETERELWQFMNDGFAQVERYEDLLRRYPELMEGAVEQVLASGSSIVGCSLANYNTLFSLDLLRRVKARCPEICTVIGGFGIALHCSPDASCTVHLDGGVIHAGQSDEPYLDDLLRSVDLAVIGEAEQTVVELVKQVQRSRDPQTGEVGALPCIPGVISDLFAPLPDGWRPAEHVAEIDQLPVPEYRDLGDQQYETNALPVLSSRGCIGNCAFCTDRLLWKRFRQRSAQGIVDEIDLLHRLHGTTKFKFNDQLINGSLAQLAQVAERLSRKPYVQEISWGGNAVVRKGMDLEYCKGLRAGGCRWLIFGVESGADPVLRAMRKGFNRDVAIQTIKAAAQAGLLVHINIILGFPGEGRQEFEETLALVREVAPYLNSIVNIGTLMVSPGTDMELRPDRFKVELPAWDHYAQWYEMSRINHPVERHKRLRECVALLDALEIPIGEVNSLLDLAPLDELPDLPMSPAELQELGSAAGEEVVRFYRELMTCPDVWLRQHAAWALGVLEDLGAVRLLRQAVDDPHPWVRANALASLRRVTPLVGITMAF